MSIKSIVTTVSTYITTHPILAKALHTFWQAFIAVFLLGISPIITIIYTGSIKQGAIALFALIVAGVAAGLSAVKNYLVYRLA